MKIIKIEISDRQPRNYEVKLNPFLKWSMYLVSQTLGRVVPSLIAPIYARLFMTPVTRAKHKKRDALLDQAESSHITHQDKRIATYRWVKKEGLPYAILSHGWESRGTALRHLVPMLHRLNYNVAAFDGLAHGDSEGRMTNMIWQAEVLDKLITHLGNVSGILGHSFGSTVTNFLYSEIRKNESLDFVVFFASPNRIDRIFDEFFRIVYAPTALKRSLVKLFENRFQYKLSELNVEDMIKNAHFRQGIIVHDELDQVTRIENSEKLHQAKPHFSFIRTKGLGHFNLVKNNRVLDALERELSTLVNKQ